MPAGPARRSARVAGLHRGGAAPAVREAPVPAPVPRGGAGRGGGAPVSAGGRQSRGGGGGYREGHVVCTAAKLMVLTYRGRPDSR